MPSFCTACYREGRTGDRFMSLCKAGQIQNCCHAQCPDDTERVPHRTMPLRTPRALGEELIEQQIGEIPKEKVQRDCPGASGED